MKKNNFVVTHTQKNLKLISVCSAILLLLGVILLMCAERIILFEKLGVFVAYVTIAVSILFVILGIIFQNKYEKQLTEQIESLSFGIEKTTKAAVMELYDPVVLLNSNGMIRWYNNAFSELCGRENIMGTMIQNIFPEIRLSVFLENTGKLQEFSYNGKDFILSGRLAEYDNSKPMLGIHFENISELTRLNKVIQEKKSVVCTAMVDNYDEVLRETPTSNHGMLIGDIERCIGLWVEKGDGFYRRYERDKFIILFEASKFEILLKEKFAVLNEIKEINQENRIPVTLSIGVGNADDDLRENDKISLAALDIALGRGGDQAVVKTESGYSFYGAKSLGVEKTSKVKARVVAKSLTGLIDNASKVIIMGHKGADFDSFGASVGLFRAVMNRGKKVYIALDKEHNNASEIMPDLMIQPEYREGIISQDRALALVDNSTLLIVVDTHRPAMVEYPEVLKRVKNIVLIDHHRRSEEFIENTLLTYHEPYASSACEMVTEIFQYMQDDNELSVVEAEALYCGIYLDTKTFTFKTGARTFEAAAYLRKMGVDPVGVRKLFRNGLDMYIQKSRVISNAKLYHDNIAIAVCEEDVKNLQLVTAQAADDLLNINGVEASFVLAELNGRVIISGRSLGNINVQIILEKLGGGGHITIAGAQLENNSLNMAELKLRNAIDDILLD